MVIEVGDTRSGALPDPVSVIVCGLPNASSLTLRVAVLVPVASGAKVTESEQLEAAGSCAGHALETVKSPLFVPVIGTEAMFSGTFWLLVTVTVLAALVAPRNCVPSDRVAGLSTTG